MPDTRYLVVDANVLVDLALELAGVPTRRRLDLEAFLFAVHQPVLAIDGELGHVRVVLSRHVVDMAVKVLARRAIASAEASEAVMAAARLLLGPDGLRDDMHEDYTALGRRSWARCGTDAEDEAVLRCAEAHSAGILTEDRDFASYLADRKVAHWSLREFLAASNRT